MLGMLGRKNATGEEVDGDSGVVVVDSPLIDHSPLRRSVVKEHLKKVKAQAGAAVE